MSNLLTDKVADQLPWAGHSQCRTGASLFDWLRNTAAALVADRALRKAETDLMALDDRLLKDIGLDRSEVGSMLMEVAHRRRTDASEWRRRPREVAE